MAEHDTWSKFDQMARRKAEDEHVLQEWARFSGGRDMQDARSFVEHVRKDIGVKGVITNVEVKRTGSGVEVVAGYYMEPDPGDDLPGMTSSVSGSTSGQPHTQSTTAVASSGANACGPGGGTPFRPARAQELSDLLPHGLPAPATSDSLPPIGNTSAAQWAEEPQPINAPLSGPELGAATTRY